MTRLMRVRPGVDPGLRRVRSGSGFRYVDGRGRAAPDRALRRIDALVIPPAWDDVWIADDPRAHIQAIGTDEAGRRQYLYHPQWRERRDRGKFARALDLAAALPQARARVTRALRDVDDPRRRAHAAAFRLLDVAALRIGSTRYLRRYGSRGLTTLQRRDAVVSGAVVTLSFPAKGGKRARVDVDDDDMAAIVETLSSGRPRAPLLWYARGRRQVALTPQEVNAYIGEVTGRPFTAKDFRTLRGTIAAAESLARSGAARTARERRRAEVRAVAAATELLGNTAAVARRSYIDPRVFREHARGHTMALDVSAEAAIRRLLLGDDA